MYSDNIHECTSIVIISGNNFQAVTLLHDIYARVPVSRNVIFL